MATKEPSTVSITLKVSMTERAAYERAAGHAAGLSRQAWCKNILNAAAEVSALPDQLAEAIREAGEMKDVPIENVGRPPGPPGSKAARRAAKRLEEKGS